MTQEEASYSVRETSRKLGVSLNYVYDLIYVDKLRAWKRGGRWRVAVSSVRARMDMVRTRLKIQSLYMEQSDAGEEEKGTV